MARLWLSLHRRQTLRHRSLGGRGVSRDSLFRVFLEEPRDRHASELGDLAEVVDARFGDAAFPAGDADGVRLATASAYEAVSEIALCEAEMLFADFVDAFAYTQDA